MSESKRPAILLTYPSCFYYPGWMERLEIKTSQLLLASYLSRDFDVTYADFEILIGRPNSPTLIKRFERRVREYLSLHEYDILALSCWTSLSYRAAVTVARISRELFPDRLVVVGGYHPSARPQEFLTDDNLFDYIILGEGELALKEIGLGFPQNGRPVATRIIKAPSMKFDDFVPYNWGLVDSFIREHFPGGLGNIYMYLSRGCPFNCSFCMEPLKDRSWRAFSPDTAVQMMHEAAARYKSFAIAISDACFGLRPSWRREFLKRLIESKPPFWIIFETRSEYLGLEDIPLLAQLEKLEIQFGLESGSVEILQLMNKTRQPERYLARFREISHQLSDNGILHRANMIFNHPGETQTTLEETFAYMDRELARTDTSLMWACHGYMHFPGCELDTNQKYYEDKFCSRFLSPRWWHEEIDQYENSQRFVPSRDLDGERAGLWKKMLADREEALRNTLSPRAFRFAAAKYFLDWQNDPRFRKN